jgi:hypothetical protein
MSEIPQDEPKNEEEFSWEKWFRLGLRAFKKTLSRYHFGMPDEFWEHLENAFNEFLAAMRIAMRTVLDRRRGSDATPPPAKKPIDIEWDDWEDDWDEDWGG